MTVDSHRATRTERHKAWNRGADFSFVPPLWRGVLACLILPLLLAGCRQSQEQLNIDLRAILPTEWVAVGQWQPVNIDADSEPEYLLFYTYDASSTADGVFVPGPMGGVIYDSQTPASVPAGEADTRPPSPWLQPYTLLPSYWRGAGYGFVAPPLTAPPTYFQVKRVVAQEVENNYFETLAAQQVGGASTTPTPATLPASDELVIFGGNSVIGGVTHISIFWWSNSREGYGSTQIAASGGLRVLEWDDVPQSTPIRKVRARYAEEDRSQLCKESIFTRYLNPNFPTTGVFRPSVYYQEGPRSLIFCYGVPKTPFYPEAVVLAWLLDANGHKELLAGDKLLEISNTLGKYLRVDSLRYYQSVDASGPVLQTQGAEPLHTQVWATIVHPTDSGEESRTYEFSLQHLPTNNSQRTTDRWQIVGVTLVEPKG